MSAQPVSFDAFVGPSYTGQSVNADCERSVNLYAEATEGGAAGKAKLVLYGTPGLTAFCTLPTSPVRGMWANDLGLYVVSGNILYNVFANGTYSARGSVGTDGQPVQIFPNGNQLLIVSAGIAYCDSGSGPVQPSYGPRTGFVTPGPFTGYLTYNSGPLFDQTLFNQVLVIGGSNYTVILINSPIQIVVSPPVPGSVSVAYSTTYPVFASNGAFLDGYFIVAQPASKQFNISALNDGTTWDPTDFASKEGYPDHIVALLADHEELWIFGTDTTEVWQNTGGALFPFARISGGFIHHGCFAPSSPVRLQNGVAWLSSDPARGGIIAYLAQGFIPNRISTHAVETAWSGYSTVSDAVSYTYTEQGHEFWVINFPSGAATWVFDATSGWWHERGWWNGSGLDRQRQQSHAYVFGQHLVGDHATGEIYTQALGVYTDAGTQITRIRTAPHLSTEQLWNFYAMFQLDLEVGTSTSTPACSLDWSDDGGHTWHAVIVSRPTQATYGGRVLWRRLGKSRDRVFRITITDAVKIALIKAYLAVERGTA